jgi:hypothetical protein
MFAAADDLTLERVNAVNQMGGRFLVISPIEEARVEVPKARVEVP